MFVLLKNLDLVRNTSCGDFTCLSEGRRGENVRLIKVSWPTLNVPFLKYQGLDLKHQ